VHQWSRWGPSMNRHWGRVVSDLSKNYPTFEAKPREDERHEDEPVYGGGSNRPRPARANSWDDWTPQKLRERRATIKPADEDQSGDESSSTSEDEGNSTERKAHRKRSESEEGREQEVRDMDRDLRIMRRFFDKWCRLAGVQGEACDDLNQDEVQVTWTRAIAPRLEGRIQMV